MPDLPLYFSTAACWLALSWLAWRALERARSAPARLVEEYIRDIPEGESRDIATVRRDLAARCGADATSLPALRERLQMTWFGK